MSEKKEENCPLKSLEQQLSLKKKKINDILVGFIPFKKT